MNAVDALSSSTLILSLNSNNYTHNEHSLPSSNDDHSNDSISATTDVLNNHLLKHDINDNHTKTQRSHRSLRKSSKIMKHRHSYGKKHHLSSSILRTGSCLKHIKSNNELTRKFKVQQVLIRQQLEQQVRELEFKQDNLLSHVENLYLYKYQLEVKCQQTNSNHELAS